MAKRLISIFAAAIAGVMIFSGCKDTGTAEVKATPEAAVTTSAPEQTEKSEENSALLAKLTKNKINGVITLTDGDTIEFEIYPDLAPKTVANFVKNVQEGFYSGTIFHRAVDGFVIQGGGYDTDYKLKSVSETVEGEFESNGFENDLSHTRGVISMARTTEPNSASTQFFIMQADADYLDGEYAAFGKVTGGMEVVDEIAKSEKMKDPPAGLKQDVPEEQYVIESITVESESTATEET